MFAWAPKSERSFSGEIYQCLLPLHGFRSSAACWFREVRSFLESLGFIMDPNAVCHFRKFLDADRTSFVQMALVVDDYALSGPEEAAVHHHSCMVQKFNATTEAGKMFVGYDIEYNLTAKFVKISFKSYITRMLERFADVDLSKGAPMRELIGCLIWCTQNLHGPEMIRVKSHGPRLNDFTTNDYDDVLPQCMQLRNVLTLVLFIVMVGLQRYSFLHHQDQIRLSMFLHLIELHTQDITKWWMSSNNVICTLETMTLTISDLALSTHDVPSRNTLILRLLWIQKCALSLAL